MDLLGAEICLATAQTLESISFYSLSTQASEPARICIRRFDEKGVCKLLDFNSENCKALAEELNSAILPVLEKWRQQQISKANKLMSPPIPNNDIYN